MTRGNTPAGPRVVDWARMGRRLRRNALAIAAAVLGAWIALGVARGGLDGATLGELVGYGLAAMFVVEVVVVGGGAARALLRAGERGDRLAGGDVSLAPPQLRRRRRR